MNKFLDPELIGSHDPDSEYGWNQGRTKWPPKREKKKKDNVVQIKM